MEKTKNSTVKGRQIILEEKSIYNKNQTPTYKNPPAMPMVKPAKQDDKK